MRLCVTCGYPRSRHETTERDPHLALWFTRYRCMRCGAPWRHDHSPEVSAALDEAQAALDAGAPLPAVGSD